MIYKPLLYKNPETGVYEFSGSVTPNAAKAVNTLINEGFLSITEEGDDKGTVLKYQTSMLEELIVGGDSYPVPIAYHVDYSDINGLVVSNATDVTEILQSDSDSSIGLFNGTVAGKCLLIGSKDRYGGVKSKIKTAGITNPDNVLAEFLSNNTPLWLEAPRMATEADFPNDRLGRNLANGSDNESEQWRFGFDPDYVPSPWDQVELIINGTPQTYRWSLIRLTDTITLDPQIEQIKPHPSGWECNKTGVQEFFGIARPRKTLTEGLKNTINNSVGSPSNENVPYSSDVIANFVDNEFTSVAKDGFLIPQSIISGLDTSIPLVLSVSYYVKGVGTGDVQLSAKIITVDDGFVYDGSATGTTVSTVDNITVSSNLIRRTVSLKLPISNVVKGGVVIYLHRDATAGNGLDTHPNNIVITNIVLDGFFWK